MEKFYGEIVRINVDNNHLKLDAKTDDYNMIQKCIVDFINNYNDYFIENYNMLPLEENFSFFIIYHSVRNLYGGNEYAFGQDYLEKKYSSETKLPIIHLTLFDIFVPPSSADGSTITIPDVKRYKKIIDSSIWNHYVPIFTTDSNGKCSTTINYNGFCQALQEVSQNTKNGLYDLSICEEYADLNARLLKQSFLNGSHKNVSPFMFHSEKIVKKNIEKAFVEKGVIDQIKQLQWRLLLVDDKAEEKLSHISESTSPKNKLDILEGLLKSALYPDLSGEDRNKKVVHRSWKPKEDEKENILIEYAETIEDAEESLRTKRYDLVLLDFYLGNESSWGTDLLDKIQNNKKDFKPSPAGEYNFMFISAYPTAVQEDMLSRGLYSQTDQWFLRRGACPTNTPWLFLYELYRMMERRIKHLQKHVEEGKKNHKLDNFEELNSPTALAFIKWLYSHKGEKAVRDRCKNAFNAFLTLRSTYDIIKYDVCDGKEHKNDKGEKSDRFVDSQENESRLIRSMFPDVVCYSNIFWEHMQHLVYLTAYGTNRQWPEMWEELFSVSNYLKNAGNEIDKVYKKEDNTGIEVVRLIRKYILNLKSENSR